MSDEEDDATSRAEIPPMLSQRQRDALVYAPQCRQQWGERQIDGVTSVLKAEDIEEFLTEFAWLKETEVALQCLFTGGFALPKAVQLLHAARRERYKTQRDQDEQFCPAAFKTAIETQGKKFHLVKQALGKGVTTRDVVSKYYLWKWTTEFKNWRRRQTVKKCKKKKKEIELLRLGNALDVDSKAKAFQGYHKTQCELCATGGKLLCCDGCARAYHFSCVQPPITKVSREDDEWFCPYCQKAFDGVKPKMIPSQDNKYCQVCLPFTGVPRTLIESMTDDSSQEEDDKVGGNSDVINDDDNVGLESNDEASGHDAKSSDPGSLTHNELDATSAIALSYFSKTDRIKSGKQEQKSTIVLKSSVLEQQGEAVVESDGGSLRVMSTNSVERSVEANPAEMRRAFVEKGVSGRKRHRKTMTPRRISPSRFDNRS
ncbi:unnamed protein product [Peronospora destructor]|uniref:PHD-type domain-containing protein n=1 Tax=Peronospora destructor TaxID=86335 RepID=A0AAV0T1A1_9STRA|nr:unnamed protein product [Peronospora destructor]